MATPEEIARAFSNGEFHKASHCLADDAVWEVIGENTFSGKQAILENCRAVSKYFESVTTRFQTQKVVVGHNSVAIMGKAEFYRDDKCVNRISACDVYEFNELDKIKRISSYCIAHKPDH